MVTTTTTTTGNIAILQCKKCGSLFGLDHADVCDICVREELATLKREVERLQEIESEAMRIKAEAHLAADGYAYDLMRTVLGEDGSE